MYKQGTKRRLKQKNSRKPNKFYKFTKKKSKSSKITKSKYLDKTKKKYKKYFGGFHMDEATQIESRDKFRAMFIPNLLGLKESIQNDDKEKIDEYLNNLRNGFRNQKMGINNRILATMNTFQPINKSDYSLEDSGNIALYPCLVIIYENIGDNKIRKKLTEIFIKNGGNINLISNKDNISALSDAIKLQDKSLIQLIIRNGASIEILNESQKQQMDNILLTAQPQFEQSLLIQQESDIDIPITKLIIPTELPGPGGYQPDIEPEFWLPLFGNNNMFILRDKLQIMIAKDMVINMDEIKNKQNTWSICKIIQGLIPTYYLPNNIKPYKPQGEYGPTFYDSPIDFYKYNIFLCATLIIFGIISQKMKFQDYQLIFKGGKAIQLVLSKIPGLHIYESEDIDILIMPNKDIVYNEINIKNLSGHIAYLTQWFLTSTTPVISVLVPNPTNPRANPFIFKLSYMKQDRRFKPISDIDFRDIPQNIKSYFSRAIDFQFPIPELDERVSFKCPDIGSLLDEKLYYYIKYSLFKDLLKRKEPIPEVGYESLTIDECDRLLEKFKRAIINLNKGLQLNRNPDLTPEQLNATEVKFIENRLKKMDIPNENIKTLVIQSLYPRSS